MISGSSSFCPVAPFFAGFFFAAAAIAAARLSSYISINLSFTLTISFFWKLRSSSLEKLISVNCSIKFG